MVAHEIANATMTASTIIVVTIQDASKFFYLEAIVADVKAKAKPLQQLFGAQASDYGLFGFQGGSCTEPVSFSVAKSFAFTSLMEAE